MKALSAFLFVSAVSSIPVLWGCQGGVNELPLPPADASASTDAKAASDASGGDASGKLEDASKSDAPEGDASDDDDAEGARIQDGGEAGARPEGGAEQDVATDGARADAEEAD